MPRAAPFCLALFQPEIPQNAGTMLRLCACLGVDAALIEPAGFPVSDRHFRRAGMDYLDHVRMSGTAPGGRSTNGVRQSAAGWSCFRPAGRHVLSDFAFQPGDIVMVGPRIGRRSRRGF